MRYSNGIYRLFFHVAVFLLIGTRTLSAQQAFEGRIVYELSYPTTMEEDPVTKQKVHKEKTDVILFIKGDKMRMETIITSGKSINICDGKAKTSVTLTETDGQKTAIFMDEEEMEEEDENHVPEGEKAKSTKSGETKEIAGYICKKEEIVLSKKSTEKLIVYYTDKIKSAALNKNIYWIQKRCKRIPGLVLQYEILNANNETIYQLIAKEVITESVSDKTFAIPTDYKIVNYEKELKEKEKK